jgi:hypothetical protein
VWIRIAVLAIGFLGLGLAKVLALTSMRQRAARLGFTAGTYRLIGAAELAGAVGLLVGLAAPLIGILAAVGLLLLLAGALMTHFRHRDGVHAAGPAVLFGLVDAAYLAVAIAGLR